MDMKKYKLFSVNLKKEENWIQSIIEQGYRLKRKSPWSACYEFEPSEEKNFIPIVRIDYRLFKKREEFEDYIMMFEDSGWKHIGGTKNSGCQYFEKSKKDASEDIFSDQSSKAERYKRISNNWLSIMIAYLPIVIVFISTGIFKIDSFFHLKELYYTPGLWELSGFSFWRAFLFETPFALMRGFSGWLFIAMIFLYGLFGLKALYWYHKEKKLNDNIHH